MNKIPIVDYLGTVNELKHIPLGQLQQQKTGTKSLLIKKNLVYAVYGFAEIQNEEFGTDFVSAYDLYMKNHKPKIQTP